MLFRSAQQRLGCQDFAPEFTLHKRAPKTGGGSGDSANWDVRETHNADTWARDCAQALKEAIDRARRQFDIAWPL